MGSSTASAQDGPQLRIEAEQHTAAIRSLSVSRDGRFAVTATEDKTVRVWRIPEAGRENSSGAWQLDRVLRLPARKGNDGKAIAAAISPDGRFVAVGGWLRYDGSSSVYVFDRASGRVIQRLPIVDQGQVSVTHSLQFSADGEFLAAGRQRGVRIWRTKDWARFRDLEEPKRDVYGLSFADDGRLAVSSYDNQIYLYGRDFTLLNSVTFGNGRRPFQVAFQPAGGLLAIGSENSLRVEIRRSSDLTLVGLGNVLDLSGRELSRVGWSADGRTLYAAGVARKVGGSINYVVAAFAPDGQRQWATGVSNNLVTSIKGLADGRIVFASVEPSLGLLSKQGALLSVRPPPIIDVRAARPPSSRYYRPLRSSREGNVLSLPFGNAFLWETERYLTVDVDQRRVRLSSEESTLTPPRLTAAETVVTNWYGTLNPRINDIPVELLPNERSRAAAISADGRQVVLGADFKLRGYDIVEQKPVERWIAETPTVAWRVNISGDGRLAFAAFGDGTIRWYDMRNGNELLALFVTPDPGDLQWVMWTPQGYYDASPGAEHLIGWHVNQGADKAALYYPISRFRDRYYRPDIVQRVLRLRDVQAALDAANKAAGQTRREDAEKSLTQSDLPPVVTIVSPKEGYRFSGRSVTVDVILTAPSNGAITEILTFINGSLRPNRLGRAGQGKKDQPGRSSRNVTIALKPGASIPVRIDDLPSRDVTLGIQAIGRDGSSAVVNVPLQYVGDPARKPDTLPNLYALVIGVGDYGIDDYDLDWASQDAKDFAAKVRTQTGNKIYKDIDVRLLFSREDTTRTKIIDGFDWLLKKVTAQDVGMIFIAGHGVTENGTYYLLPSNGDISRTRATGVHQIDLQETITRLGGRLGLVFLDTCYAGASLTGKVSDGREDTRSIVDSNGIANFLSDAAGGAIVFTSAQGNELAIEGDEWRNGAFTEAVLAGLSGDADYSRNGRISTDELNRFVRIKVNTLTDGSQRPQMVRPDAVPDFEIFGVN